MKQFKCDIKKAIDMCYFKQVKSKLCNNVVFAIPEELQSQIGHSKLSFKNPTFFVRKNDFDKIWEGTLKKNRFSQHTKQSFKAKSFIFF